MYGIKIEVGGVYDIREAVPVFIDGIDGDRIEFRYLEEEGAFDGMPLPTFQRKVIARLDPETWERGPINSLGEYLDRLFG